jgi:dienelactone hydrolase
MHYMRTVCAILCRVMLAGVVSSSASAKPPIIEHLEFETNLARHVKPVKITATLYLPIVSSPAPAMVIISSSGGVIDWNEGYYARELSKQGIAALVVDSFKPRGILDIVEKQLSVTSWHMENDAFAALTELQKDKRIDPSRIGIMGISKGGIVAQNSAFLIRRGARGTGTLAFAAHVPIVPDCAGQFRDAKTTGKPIFYMLAELDDADPHQPCLDYIHRINVAGNPNAAAKVYKGAHHNWERTKPLIYLAKAQNGSKCTSLIEDNGDRTFAAGNVYVKDGDVGAWMTKNCYFLGEHVGGGTDKLKRQATDDLLAFLRSSGF